MVNSITGYPLRNLVYEKVKEAGQISDLDLLNEFNRNGVELTMRDLNRILLHLEINGLITVRWVAKDRRRIEVVQPRGRETPQT